MSSKSKSSSARYRFIGSHAEVLEGGAPLAPGDYITLDPGQATGTTQTLLDDGLLIDASGVESTEAKTEESEA
jgi:hypothetical protein